MNEPYELYCSLCGDALRPDVDANTSPASRDAEFTSLVCETDCQTRTMEQPGRYPLRPAGACEFD